MKTTKANMTTAFQHMLTNMGLREAKSYNDVGGYLLEGAYGGYRITKVTSEKGGTVDVTDRLKMGEMRSHCIFASSMANSRETAPVQLVQPAEASPLKRAQQALKSVLVEIGRKNKMLNSKYLMTSEEDVQKEIEVLRTRASKLQEQIYAIKNK